MAEILRMPEVAANATDAVLAEWAVPVGAQFSAGDTIVSVETEKALVDVEAEAAGVMLRHLVAEGSQVDVGAPIALLGAVGEVIGDTDEALAKLGVAPARDEPVPESVDSDAPATDAPAAVGLETQAAPEESARLFSSPIARRIARETSIDLAGITGTGPGGRIRRRDVDTSLARRSAMSPASDDGRTVASSRARLDSASIGQPGGYVDEPVSRIRRAIAARLTGSVQSAPHFYLRGSARVDRFLAMRQEINASGEIKASVNDLLVMGAARAHRLVPAMNVIWNGDTIRHFEQVDVSIAIATEAGLVTPVVRAVDRLTLSQLVSATQDLASRAKARKLQQYELEGGTITVSNLGMFGTEDFAAIINPPQAAILAVGSARPEAIVVDGQVQVAMILRVTLSIDHRPVDGATGAKWLQAFLGLLENPAQILI